MEGEKSEQLMDLVAAPPSSLDHRTRPAKHRRSEKAQLGNLGRPNRQDGCDLANDLTSGVIARIGQPVEPTDVR